MSVIPKIPSEYIGKYTTKTEYTRTTPRKWTPKRIIEDLKLLEIDFETLAQFGHFTA